MGPTCSRSQLSCCAALSYIISPLPKRTRELSVRGWRCSGGAGDPSSHRRFPHPVGVCGNVSLEKTLLPSVPGSWWLFVLCSLGSFGSVFSTFQLMVEMLTCGFWCKYKLNKQVGARGAPGAAVKRREPKASSVLLNLWTFGSIIILLRKQQFCSAKLKPLAMRDLS